MEEGKCQYLIMSFHSDTPILNNILVIQCAGIGLVRHYGELLG